MTPSPADLSTALSLLLNASSDAAFLVNTQGLILQHNSPGEQLLLMAEDPTQTNLLEILDVCGLQGQDDSVYETTKTNSHSKNHEGPPQLKRIWTWKECLQEFPDDAHMEERTMEFWGHLKQHDLTKKYQSPDQFQQDSGVLPLTLIHLGHANVWKDPRQKESVYAAFLRKTYTQPTSFIPDNDGDDDDDEEVMEGEDNGVPKNHHNDDDDKSVTSHISMAMTEVTMNELKQKASLMKGMINASFEAMFQIDQHGIIENANQAATRIFGWKKHEFVGQNIVKIMHGKDRENHGLYLSSYFSTHKKQVIGKQRRMTAIKKDGTKFPILLGVREIKGTNGESHFCGFLKDLTQQEFDMERLQRREQISMGMINATFDPMFQINDKGVIQIVNQAACDHLGYTKEELMGSNISKICGGEHGKHHDQYLQRYLRTGQKKVMGRCRELMVRRKDGTECPIELGLSEINTVWGERLFCGFIRDIRRQRYNEQEVKEKEKLTQGMLQVSGDPLFAIDGHKYIFKANLRTALCFGFTKVEEILGRNVADLMPADDDKKHPKIRTIQMKTIDKHIASKDEDKTLEMKILVAAKGGRICRPVMRMREVPGPFPVMFGREDESDDSQRIFAVSMDFDPADLAELMAGKSFFSF